MNTTVTAERCIFFNQGQRLTPYHLNAVGEFARKNSSRMGSLLAGSEGILEGAYEEFQIEVISNDERLIQIGRGAALNSQGELLILEAPALLDLASASPKESALYYIQIRPEEILEAPYQDQDIPEFQGFEYKRYSNKLLISKQMADGAVEIGRIHISKSTSEITLGESLTELEAPEGTIDTRYAKKVRILGAHLWNFEDQFSAQRTVESYRHTLYEIRTYFDRLKTVSSALQSVIFLQSELTEAHLSPSKILFFSGEVRRSLLDLLEELREVMGAKAPFWNELFESANKIGIARGERNVSDQFRILSEINQLLRDKILNAQTVQDRRILIREALRDLKTLPFSAAGKHSFGGCLFSVGEEFKGDHLFKSASSDAKFVTRKTQSARYSDGTQLTEKGAFYSEGRIHLQLENLKPGLETVVMTRLYKRRGLQEFSFILNGQKIHYEKLTANENVDQFLNIGTVIDGAGITAKQNQLTLDVHKVDLDFGLFGVWVYQLEGAPV